MIELLAVVGITIFISVILVGVLDILVKYQNKKINQKWIKEKEEERLLEEKQKEEKERLLKEKRDAEIKNVLNTETEDNEIHLVDYSFKLLHCLIQNKLYVEVIENYLCSGVIIPISSFGWLDEDLKFKRRLTKKIKQNLVEVKTEHVSSSVYNSCVDELHEIINYMCFLKTLKKENNKSS